MLTSFTLLQRLLAGQKDIQQAGPDWVGEERVGARHGNQRLGGHAPQAHPEATQKLHEAADRTLLRDYGSPFPGVR